MKILRWFLISPVVVVFIIFTGYFFGLWGLVNNIILHKTINRQAAVNNYFVQEAVPDTDDGSQNRLAYFTKVSNEIDTKGLEMKQVLELKEIENISKTGGYAWYLEENTPARRALIFNSSKDTRFAYGLQVGREIVFSGKNGELKMKIVEKKNVTFPEYKKMAENLGNNCFLILENPLDGSGNYIVNILSEI